MHKIEKITLLSGVISLVLWVVVVAFMNSYLSEILGIMVAAIILTIISICLGGVCLIRRYKPNASPYFMFGIFDIIIEICIVGYAVFDMLTDTGIMAGILGFLLLCFVAPIPLVLLIIDVIIYFVKKKRK